MEKRIFLELTEADLLRLVAEGVRSALGESPKSANPPPEEGLLTIKEACQLLDVCKVTIWEWRRQGRIKGYNLGRRIYFKKAELMAALQK